MVVSRTLLVVGATTAVVGFALAALGMRGYGLMILGSVVFTLISSSVNK